MISPFDPPCGGDARDSQPLPLVYIVMTLKERGETSRAKSKRKTWVRVIEGRGVSV
jgi:hypothetical protein